MRKLNFFAAAVLAAGAISACNIESVVDDLENSAIDAAFKTIQDAARSKGGDAVLVRPGADYTIEINNPESAINGAKVVIPAAAIPTDVEQAAVAIYGVDAGGAIKSTDSHKLQGPAASIGFTKLPGAEEVTPLADLQITLPYTEAATAPAEQIVLINVNGDGSLAEFTGSSATGGKVTGGSKKYNMFSAFWAVDYDGTSEAPEGTLIYKITSADGSKSCAGLVDDAGSKFSEAVYGYGGTDGFRFRMIVGTALTIDTVGDSAITPLAMPTTIVNVPLNGPYGSWALNCASLDGTVLGGTVTTANALSLSVANFVKASDGTSETCGVNACTPHTGTLEIDAMLDFVASDGSTVKASLNATAANFTWYTEP